MKCPICKFKLKVDTYNEEHIILEEYHECKQCGKYKYEFVHGYVRIYVDKTELIYGWNSSNTTVNKAYFIHDKAVRRERKRWLKLNKGLRQISLERCKWCNGSGADLWERCFDCYATGYKNREKALLYLSQLYDRLDKKAMY